MERGRPDAAAAKLARQYAAWFCATDRHIFGYVFGGSGGGLLVIGAAERIREVRDGFVPIVTPNPTSLANGGAMGSLVSLALGPKLDAVTDAVSAGSGRDPTTLLDPAGHAIFACAERRVAPPPSSRYTVPNSEVALAATATERGDLRVAINRRSRDPIGWRQGLTSR